MEVIVTQINTFYNQDMQKSISEYKYFICLLCKGMVLINFYNFLNVFIFCFQSGQEQSLSIIFYHFLLLLLSYATLTSESSKHKMCTKVIMNKPVLGLQITDNLEKKSKQFDIVSLGTVSRSL